jgi:sugar lactone lactonase YvrE
VIYSKKSLYLLLCFHLRKLKSHFMNKLYIKLTAVLICMAGLAQAQVVTTVAGSTAPGSANGTAPGASFYRPWAVAAYGGNLFVADAYNNDVRKIDMTTLIVTTLAGSTAGGSADGIGAAAHFWGPSGIVADGKGNLYVTDNGNHEIRKIVISTGAVTTFAGSTTHGSADGIGAAASFYTPTGLAIDGSGNLYVADWGNNEVRKIVISSATVTTLAGSTTPGHADGTGPAASFDTPNALAVDRSGNLFVADEYNNEIRKIVIATGAVTTFAGSLTSGSADGTGTAASFYYPSGLATYADTLFVADYSNNKIRKIIIPTAVVTTLAGNGGFGHTDGTGTAAYFYYPTGIAMDTIGNLYIADQLNNEIRKIVTSTKVVTTFAGSTISGSADGSAQSPSFWLPADVATDGTNIYVADASNNEIRQINISTSTVTTLAGSPSPIGGHADGTGAAASFNNPLGVAVDSSGNLYVADVGNNEIRKIVISTGVVTTFAGSLSSGSADGTGASASFNEPIGLAFYAGSLYVIDDYNSEIRKVVLPTGVVTTLAGNLTWGHADGIGTAATFDQPSGITSDGKGNLYVCDNGNSIIRKFVISTGAVTTLAGTAFVHGSNDGTGPAAQFYYPFGIAADALGNVFVSDQYNNEIRQIVAATGVVTTYAGSTSYGHADGTGAAASFHDPEGICTDAAGDLYVADDQNNEIRKVASIFTSVPTIVSIPSSTSIYPNPFNNNATIRISNNIQPYNATIEIYDETGRIVCTINNINSHMVPIDKGQLSQGIYFYTLYMTDGSIVSQGKFIIE